MSLGNVSYHDTRIQHFTQAIEYLRMAEAIPGYSLPTHLSQYAVSLIRDWSIVSMLIENRYLEEYGRLIP